MSKPFILITGASSGIGTACAEILAKDGRNLILVARRLERLESIRDDLVKRYGVEVEVRSVDVSDLAQIDRLFEELNKFSIEALINNAGLARTGVVLQEYDWKDIGEMLDVNVRGFVRMAQLSIPLLAKTQGHIVNLGSIAGEEAYEGGSVYCATKAFVKMISKGLRIDVMGTGIRVTNIAPGAVNTEFSTVRFHGDKAKADKAYEGFVPLQAADIADCIHFALTRPKHVNIDHMIVMPTAQATAKRVFRS